MTPAWLDDAPPNLVKLALGRCLIATMDVGRWNELALLTDASREIIEHPRLIRSLRFGDEDYDGHVFAVVPNLLDEQPEPARDPWDPQPVAFSIHSRFPNLRAVSDYLRAPAWIAEHDPSMFQRLFQDQAGDATLPDGTVLSAAAAAAARLEVGEMRRQVERIRRDHATDPEAAIGQAKDLIETVCRTILGLTGNGDVGEPLKLPQLVKRTLLHLGIDPTQLDEASKDAVEARAAKQIIGGVSAILNGAGELRNSRGTGHGRSRSMLVSDALARLTVGAALPAAIFLIESYESNFGEGLAPVLAKRPPSGIDGVRRGDIVRHATYGLGQVLATEGSGPNLIAKVDFGPSGTKRLLLRFANVSIAN